MPIKAIAAKIACRAVSSDVRTVFISVVSVATAAATAGPTTGIAAVAAANALAAAKRSLRAVCKIAIDAETLSRAATTSDAETQAPPSTVKALLIDVVRLAAAVVTELSAA
ncbi:hypothetical protein [Desulfotomaculum nigrificans]|uniref:hypothetical protein n=1 Tax=Desulfotomaculum nigrificans TaxID=1565 RepID=UPI000489A839|nr:hypothetical protein [Desulfotomaculum nigrificans]